MLKANEHIPTPHPAAATPEMLRLHESRIVIEHVTPQLEGGRYPIKREAGDVLEVGADIFRDGHDVLAAVLRHRPLGDEQWTETPMSCLNPGLDLWAGRFALE